MHQVMTSSSVLVNVQRWQCVRRLLQNDWLTLETCHYLTADQCAKPGTRVAHRREGFDR